MAPPSDQGNKITPTDEDIEAAAAAADIKRGANDHDIDQFVISNKKANEEAIARLRATRAAAAAHIKRGAKDDIEIVISNNKANEEAIARLRTTRKRIDSVISEPTPWEQIVTHKVLIVTVFLTILGMAGSALGLAAGYASEKDRARYVLAGALLSLVGNFVSSATGIFVKPPTLGK